MEAYMTPKQIKELSELVALAALAYHEATTMLVTNQDRERRGYAMAYGENCLLDTGARALEARLKALGIISV